MRRGRVVGLAVVGLALAGAAVYASTSEEPSPADPRLAALRVEAALDPCPSGVGPSLPALTLPCLGGGPDVRLDAPATGVPTLVNVYGSWCPPCQEEMPLLAQFDRLARGKVALLGVDTEDDPRLALEFAKDFRQHWPAVVDDDGVVLRRYGSGPPLTLFVDRSGAVVHVQRGAFSSLAELKAQVRTHLGVTV